MRAQTYAMTSLKDISNISIFYPLKKGKFTKLYRDTYVICRNVFKSLFFFKNMILNAYT